MAIRTNLSVVNNTLYVGDQPYPKGSIRPVYRGDFVDLIFPWWNNQSLIPNDVNWSEIGNAGTAFTSLAALKTFMDANGAVAGGGMVIGNTVTGGTVNEVLYIDSAGKLAVSPNFLFDGSSIITGVTVKQTQPGVIQTDGLAATPVSALSIQNTTPATTLVKSQVPGWLAWLARAWNGTSSVISGFRARISKTSGASNPYSIFSLDFTIDGATYTTLFSLNSSGGVGAFNFTGSGSFSGGLTVGGFFNGSSGGMFAGSIPVNFTSGIGLVGTVKSADYAATNTDCVIYVDTSGGDVTITLSDPSLIQYQIYHIKKISAANQLTITTPVGLIDTWTSLFITTYNEAVTIHAFNSNYHILS